MKLFQCNRLLRWASFPLFTFAYIFIFTSCENKQIRNSTYTPSENALVNPKMTYKDFTPKEDDIKISRADFQNRLYGFWLGQCIANWTGLITEMDKIGGEGKDGKGAGFYTRENWGKADEPNIWDSNNYSDTIDFLFEEEGGIWGADDDTDIEYMYQ
ncbi:MAG: hypothetical protein AB8G22_23555, partial [Saprospiraceae bacterium]